MVRLHQCRPGIRLHSSSPDVVVGYVVKFIIDGVKTHLKQNPVAGAAIVSQSDHLLVLPSMVAELLATHWPLKSLPLPEDVPDYHLNCVWHPVHAQQPALVWLKDLMKELVGPR